MKHIDIFLYSYLRNTFLLIHIVINHFLHFLLLPTFCKTLLITPRNIFALSARSSFSSLVCSHSQRFNLLFYTIITWYYLKPYINYKAYSTKEKGKLSIFGHGSIIFFACLLTCLLNNIGRPIWNSLYLLLYQVYLQP